jgi:hypothetical protein
MCKHTAATADPTTDYGSAHADALCSKLAENPSFDRILAAQTPTIGGSITKGHLTPYLVAIGATMLAALACYPAVAHADDTSFLEAVQAAGLLSADNTPSTALALGHQICDDITANGVAGVADSMGLARQAGIPPKAAAAMLQFSVYNLCTDNRAAADAWASNPNQNHNLDILPKKTPGLGDAAGHSMPTTMNPAHAQTPLQAFCYDNAANIRATDHESGLDPATWASDPKNLARFGFKGGGDIDTLYHMVIDKGAPYIESDWSNADGDIQWRCMGQ